MTLVSCLLLNGRLLQFHEKKRQKQKETQCGNFRIFLSLRFYVKSGLENVEVLNTGVFAIYRALVFDNLGNLSLQKDLKLIKIQIQSHKLISCKI